MEWPLVSPLFFPLSSIPLLEVFQLHVGNELTTACRLDFLLLIRCLFFLATRRCFEVYLHRLHKCTAKPTMAVVVAVESGWLPSFTARVCAVLSNTFRRGRAAPCDVYARLADQGAVISSRNLGAHCLLLRFFFFLQILPRSGGMCTRDYSLETKHV